MTEPYWKAPRFGRHDAWNVMEWIPYNLHADVISGTGSQDVVSYINTAIVEVGARATQEGKATLYFPGGVYGCSTAVIVGVDAVILTGPVGHSAAFANTSKLAQIRAIADRRGSSQRTALIYCYNRVSVCFEGLSFHPAGFAGSTMFYSSVTHGSISRCRFETRSASRPRSQTYEISSVSSTNDTITLTSVSQLQVGDRVDAYVASNGGLPGGLAIETPYYVIGIGGGLGANTIQISATPGGSAVNITSTGSGIRWLVRGGHHIDSVDTATDTITVAGHPWSNGDRVRCWNKRQMTSSGQKQPFSGAAFVINATTDTFQVSLTPGGSALDLTTAGGSGRHIGYDWASVSGGGHLYTRIVRNYFPANSGAVYFQNPEDPGASAYYGINVGCFSENVCFHTAVSISGKCQVDGNTFEGAPPTPDIAVLNLGDASGLNTLTSAKENYFELTESPSGWCGVTGSGSTVFGPNNNVIGPSSTYVESIGHFQIMNNSGSSFPSRNGYHRWGTGLYALNPASASIAIEAGFPAFQNNAFSSNVTNLTTWAVQAQTDTIKRQYQNWRPGVGIEQGGTLINDYRVTANDPTSLDLGLGNRIKISATGAHTISTLTNASPGAHHTLIAATALTTLGAAVFETLTGTDYLMLSGEAIDCVVNQAGTALRLVRSLGAVVRTYASGAQSGNIAAANVFSAAPSAGLYEVSGYLLIPTPATTGTVAVTVTYNDGTARTLTLAGIADAAPTTLVSALDGTAGGPGYYRLVPATIKVASGNPQHAATWTALTGTPSFTLELAYKRVA